MQRHAQQLVEVRPCEGHGLHRAVVQRAVGPHDEHARLREQRGLLDADRRGAARGAQVQAPLARLGQRQAVAHAQASGIVFIDEIDKVASRSDHGSAEVSRQGVQRDLLPLVEGTAVNTKYGIVRTDHILFIASGAFHLSRPSDLIPELQGRFPIRVELSSLTREDFVKIITQPRNALSKQYQALLSSEGVTLNFSDDAIAVIADLAFEVNQEVENNHLCFVCLV